MGSKGLTKKLKLGKAKRQIKRFRVKLLEMKPCFFNHPAQLLGGNDMIYIPYTVTNKFRPFCLKFLCSAWHNRDNNDVFSFYTGLGGENFL